ncbi:2-hydroxyacid dehydrogenase [Geminicoccaceae bacterium 1502E]|nr:2-hydroxyacid dehydrogenase [Geminicoccaceae bacterium 1502E]
MNKAVMLGLSGSYEEQVRAQLRTPWDLQVLPADVSMDELGGALADARAFLTNRFGRAMKLGAGVELLQVTAAGVDSIDLEAVPPSLWVCNAYGHEDAMGEYAIMAMLLWSHRFLEASSSFKGGSWDFGLGRPAALHGEVAGRTVAVIGLGRIGRAVATRAAAMGMHVLGCNRSPREPGHGVAEVLPWQRMDEMLARADFVVLACALSPETEGLIDAERLAAMKPDAVLINLARGAVADEKDLFEALRERRIGGAVIDTWWHYPSDEEPDRRPSTLPYHELGNVLMTPHCSAWTDGLFRRRGGHIAENLNLLAEGRRLLNIVRPPRTA